LKTAIGRLAAIACQPGQRWKPLRLSAPIIHTQRTPASRGRSRASRRGDWRDSLRWADRERPLISRRAYAAFLLTNVSAHAARTRSVEALWRLPLEALRHGRPRPRDLLLFAGIWLLPESWRARAADLWSRRSRRRNTPARRSRG
jgi:hypothetical protein